MSKWYKKRELNHAVLEAIGINPCLHSMLSERAHTDDMTAIAKYLGTYTQILTDVLYEACEAPGANPKEMN